MISGEDRDRVREKRVGVRGGWFENWRKKGKVQC